MNKQKLHALAEILFPLKQFLVNTEPYMFVDYKIRLAIIDS